MKRIRLYISMLTALLLCTTGLHSQVLLINKSDAFEKQQDTIIEKQRIISLDSTLTISPDMIRAIKRLFNKEPDSKSIRQAWQIKTLTTDLLQKYEIRHLVEMRPFALRIDFFSELKWLLGDDIDKYLLPTQLTSRIKAAPMTYNQVTSSRYSVIWVSPFDTMILVVPEWYASDYENLSLWDFE